MRTGGEPKDAQKGPAILVREVRTHTTLHCVSTLPIIAGTADLVGHYVAVIVMAGRALATVVAKDSVNQPSIY